jgi:hypothetical protein
MFQQAYAESVAAAIGVSIPPNDMHCFRVVSGSVENTGACGPEDRRWEIQLPVGATGEHGIDLYTSSGVHSCTAFTTNQYAGITEHRGPASINPEGSDFRHRFNKLIIHNHWTMSVVCNIPAGESMLTVSSFRF